MRPPTNLARRPAIDHLPPTRQMEDTAASGVHLLLAQIGAGTLSRRRVERVRAATSALPDLMGDIERVITHGQSITRSSAQLARDVEQLGCEVDEFLVKRAEAAERAQHVGAAVREELAVRTVTATLEREKVEFAREKLRHERGAYHAARTREHEQIAEERAALQRRIDRGRAVRDARAEAARRKSEEEATRIVRDVQIGAVPADPAHPYHAYAACLYLSAKLDEELSSSAAALRTREAVLQMMLGTTVAPEDIATYHAAYLELKQRAAATTKRRDTAELFNAVETLTGGSVQ